MAHRLNDSFVKCLAVSWSRHPDMQPLSLKLFWKVDWHFLAND
jgi:hypothetical protein